VTSRYFTRTPLSTASSLTPSLDFHRLGGSIHLRVQRGQPGQGVILDIDDDNEEDEDGNA